jgi:hypothetical protein
MLVFLTGAVIVELSSREKGVASAPVVAPATR